MKKLLIHEEQEAPKGRPEKKGHSIQSSAFPAITEKATENTYEERKKIVLEWRKSAKDHGLLKELMSLTFPMRR